jgi:nucleoside-diphosphate-sugar epimerase
VKTQTKILIVGGNGFIGTNLISRAVSLGWNVTNLSLSKNDKSLAHNSIVTDIANPEQLKKNLTDHSYDFVINCAGYVDHSPFFENGAAIINTHFNGIVNLINLIDKSKLKKFINIGSSDEYGANKSPQNEQSRENPFSSYSLAKTAASHFLQMMNQSESFPGTTIRLFLVYGPGQARNRFIPQIINGCIEDHNFATSGGDQIRDFCFIDDAIDAIFLALISKEASGKILNIGSGEPIEIKSMINLLKHMIGTGKPQLGKIPYRSSENMSLYADINLAKNILQWSPKISLEAGLRLTIDSFLSN